ncbi:MAG: hypothetical protein WED34_21380 [Planctomycetales bacterium]
MKRIAAVMACAVVAAGLAAVQAAEEADAKTQAGTLVSANATQVVVKTDNGVEKTVQFADAHTVTVDGKAGTHSDLKAGMKVTITLNELGRATKVEAKSAAKPVKP